MNISTLFRTPEARATLKKKINKIIFYFYIYRKNFNFILNKKKFIFTKFFLVLLIFKLNLSILKSYFLVKKKTIDKKRNIFLLNIIKS
jgi:predicted nucleotidyltransferase